MKQLYTFLFFFSLSLFSTVYSQTLDASLIELYYANDSYPQGFIAADSGFFFTASDPMYGSELWFSDGTIENTYMVKDIAEGERNSNIITLAVVGDLLYFRARPNFQTDPQLWVSDGTAEGTHFLKDINISDAFPYKGKIYFQYVDEANGAELWCSDGTEAGTKLFKDLRSGTSGSSPMDFFVFKNSLFFIANNGSGRELWKSDGTSEGTLLVKDINPTGSGVYDRNQFLVHDGNFYFMASDGEHGYELFKSDGTEEGTLLVKDINSNGSSSNRLRGTVTENGIFFIATDGQNGTELWKSDGTEEGTLMVKNINSDSDSFSLNGVPDNFATLGSTVFFSANDGVNGLELWKTDGSESGTQIVKNIAPEEKSSRISNLKSINGKLFFLASSDNPDKIQLWTTDGSQEGTIPLSDTPITNNLSSFQFKMFSFNNKLFYDADSEIYGIELWQSDGTVEGTSLFMDFDHSWGGIPQNLIDIDGLLYFGARHVSSGNQLFISNGTSAGTKMVKRINQNDYNSLSEESEVIAMDQTLFMSANDGIHGFELWKSDGTESGTIMVKDINEGKKSSMNNDRFYPTFSVIENKLYFMADDGIHGMELWVSDGTSQGTTMVKYIFSGTYSSFPSNFVFSNNSIYFKAKDESGTALWETDGTPGGTVKIRNFNDFRRLRVVNNKLIIIAETSGTSYGPHDLWSSDGTAEGTFHLKSFGDGIDTEIEFMTIFNDELYFVAKSPDSYRKSIYKTNGTVEGTQLIYDGKVAEANVDINIIVKCGDYVYFVVERENDYDGAELWRTAGTQESTILVSNTTAGTYNYLESVTCFQGDLYYKDAFNNQQIWKTDKNTTSASKLNYTIDGKEPSAELIISKLYGSKNVLYFVGTTPQTGPELYAIQNGELASLPENQPVNEQISTDIFNIQVTKETCAGKSNGSVSIKSSEEHSYIATLNGKQYNFTKNLLINNLNAGDYKICISEQDNANFNQCFEFKVEGGGTLAGRVQSKRTTEGNLLNIKIQTGSAPFVVKLDGKIIGNFLEPDFSILTDKSGRLEIVSSKLCEGQISFEVEPNSSIVAFPNPTSSFLNIVIRQNTADHLQVLIYNENGQLMTSKVYKVQNNILTLDLQNFDPGLYYAVIGMKTPYTVKFIKK